MAPTTKTHSNSVGNRCLWLDKKNSWISFFSIFVTIAVFLLQYFFFVKFQINCSKERVSKKLHELLNIVDLGNFYNLLIFFLELFQKLFIKELRIIRKTWFNTFRKDIYLLLTCLTKYLITTTMKNIFLCQDVKRFFDGSLKFLFPMLLWWYYIDYKKYFTKQSRPSKSSIIVRYRRKKS